MPIDQSEWQAKGDYMVDFEWVIRTLKYNKLEEYDLDDITVMVFGCSLMVIIGLMKNKLFSHQILI